MKNFMGLFWILYIVFIVGKALESVLIGLKYIWFALPVIYICIKTIDILLESYQIKYAKCEHGITTGNDISKCKICTEKAKEIHDKYIKDNEEKIRKEKILSDALSLQINQRNTYKMYRLNELQKIRELSPRGFEEYVAKLLTLSGYETKLTPATNDGGIDIIAVKNGKEYLVECKKYNETNKVSRPYLQKFMGAIQSIDRELSQGIFVTTSDFTKPTIELANKHNITLVNGERLLKKHEQLFDKKYRIKVMCEDCGDIVEFDVNSVSTSKECRSGHLVNCIEL